MYLLSLGGPGGQPPRSSVSACPSPNRAGSPAPSLAGSTSSLPTAVLSSQRDTSINASHGPFPTGRKGLVERSSLIRHTTSHLHPVKGKTDFKMIQKLSGSQAATNSTSAENQAFMYEVGLAQVCQLLGYVNVNFFLLCSGCQPSPKWRGCGLAEGWKIKEII